MKVGILIVALVLVGVLLAACGGSSAPAAAPKPTGPRVVYPGTLPSNYSTHTVNFQGNEYYTRFVVQDMGSLKYQNIVGGKLTVKWANPQADLPVFELSAPRGTYENYKQEESLTVRVRIPANSPTGEQKFTVDISLPDGKSYTGDFSMTINKAAAK